MIRLTTPLLPFVNRSDDDVHVQPYFDALAALLRDHRASAGTPLHCLGVTSCRQGEGVSTVARNLAVALAGTREQATLLVDASEGNPEFASQFGIGTVPGLSEAVLASRPLDECVRSTSLNHLSIMTAGECRLAPSSFHAERMRELITALRSKYEFVIFDMPRANELTHCFAIAGQMDGVMLVVEPEAVSADEAKRAKLRLLNADAKLLGVVVNKQK